MDIDLDELMRAFIVESTENLDTIEGSLVTLERSPGNVEVLQEMFRAAHTLKGNASCVGADAITEVAHRFEDVLERLKSGDLSMTPGRVSVVLQVTDLLRDMVAATAAGREPESNGYAELLRLIEEGSENGAIAGDSTARSKAVTRTLRVSVEKLDRMLDLAGELAISRGRLRAQIESAATADEHGVLDTLRESERIHSDLQEEIMRARMIPLGPLFRQYARVVRDLSHRDGKDAILEITGEDVEVDTAIAEQLRDPLTHMIRNAIDHGLELPAIRRQGGKSETGTIRLAARYEATSVIVTVGDDGAGLDRERIRSRALASGIDADALTAAEVDALIFEPGFSTAAEVSELSGRGIGMDVVRRNVESLRGSLSVESAKGEGTIVTLRFPLTLGMIEGLMVATGDEVYVVPIDSIIECIDLPGSDSSLATGIINLRGEPLPFIRLGRLFHLDGAPAERESIVVLRNGTERAGIAVDRLLGAVQTVVKPLGGFFGRVRGVGGSAILGSGRVALTLDVAAIFDLIRRYVRESAVA